MQSAARGGVVDGGEHQDARWWARARGSAGTRSMPLVPGRFTSSSMPMIFWRRRIVERLLAGGRDGDLVALLDEILADGVPDRLFVVHDEQGDGAILRGTRGAPRRREADRTSLRCCEKVGPGKGSVNHPTNSTVTRSGIRPAAWPRSSSACTACRPARAVVHRPLVDVHPDERVGPLVADAPVVLAGVGQRRAPGAPGRRRCWRGGPGRSARSPRGPGPGAPRCRRAEAEGRCPRSHQAPRSAQRWRPASA